MFPLYRSTVHSAGLYMLARAVPKTPPALRRSKPQVWWWADSWADARQQWHTQQSVAPTATSAPTDHFLDGQGERGYFISRKNSLLAGD